MTDDTTAYVAITRLQSAYADVVTRRAWGDLDALFATDAPIRIDTVTRPLIELTGAAALGEFIDAAVARFEFFEFVILNTVVDVRNDNAATGRLWMVEVRQEHDGTWSNAFGRYDDTYARTDGRWRFAERRYRSIARRIGNDPATIFT